MINWILDIEVEPIKIFGEYVGANVGIQVPLLVIDRRGVSVMFAKFSNQQGLHT